jgi:dienelactone hydrolase
MSEGETIAGDLYRPQGDGPSPGVVLHGPLTSIKEQATGNHARALAERGFVSLAFDARFFGESGGMPRQYESPARKIEDARNALSYLSTRADVDPKRIAGVGVCAGAGYMAGAIAADDRFAGFGAIAGFFHDARKQREWMGDDAYESALSEAHRAREHFEATREATTIPAVALSGPRAMPLDEAFEYYGTPRGGVAGYVNAFAVLSRADTLPYDAQIAAPNIRVPTVLVHSDRALAPALARSFYEGLAVKKSLTWLESKGQIDFYDDPQLIGRAADALAAFFRSTNLLG